MCYCFNKELLLCHNCVKKKKSQKYRGNVHKLHDHFRGNYLAGTHDLYFPMKGSLLNWINTLLIAKFHCRRLLSSHHFQNKPISYFFILCATITTSSSRICFQRALKKTAAKNIQEMHDTGLPVLMKLDHTSVTGWEAKYILQLTKKLKSNFSIFYFIFLKTIQF